MTALKTTLVAAAAVAFTTPSFAQNFQGFGAPNYVIQQYEQAPAQQQKPVVLRTYKTAKHKSAMAR